MSAKADEPTLPRISLKPLRAGSRSLNPNIFPNSAKWISLETPKRSRIPLFRQVSPKIFKGYISL
jgi:hypothetical protein